MIIRILANLNTFYKKSIIVLHNNRCKKSGFAMIIFVVITAVSLIFVLIQSSENQRKTADSAREIIKTERSLQSSFLCAGYISNTLARYPLLNEDLIQLLKNLSINELSDTNYWVNKSNYSNFRQQGKEHFNCRVISFEPCLSDSACAYHATIDGFNTFNNEDENNHSKIYIEWVIDEYRLYIKSLGIL